MLFKSQDCSVGVPGYVCAAFERPNVVPWRSLENLRCLWYIPGEPLRVLVASQGGPWMFPLGSLGDPGDVWEVLGASQVVVGSPCGVAGWSLDIPSSRKMPKSSTEPKCFSQCRKIMLFRSHDSSMDGLGRVQGVLKRSHRVP